jgi:hypothetical protein
MGYKRRGNMRYITRFNTELKRYEKAKEKMKEELAEIRRLRQEKTVQYLKHLHRVIYWLSQKEEKTYSKKALSFLLFDVDIFLGYPWCNKLEKSLSYQKSVRAKRVIDWLTDVEKAEIIKLCNIKIRELSCSYS